MTPFPKWVGMLAALGAFASGAVAMMTDPAVVAILPPEVAAKIAAICGVIASLSHSLTGTGGKK